MTTIELKTCVERPSDPKDYITKIAGTSIAAPGTPHPLWDAFLKRVTNDDATLIGFLQRFLGYCMTGATWEHVLVFLYGTGANGKSTFIKTVTGMFGDYAIVAPMELFLASKYERHPTEIAKLRGARLVVAQETEKGRRWDEQKIKQLTSDDKLTGRFMHQNFFDFTPTHKLIITGNNKPTLRTIDEAIRRRFLLVPFTVKIPPRERDTKLAEKLQAEWPAIMRWMVDGCMQWQRGGLLVPDVVRKATDSYFDDQNTIGQWLEDWAVNDASAFETTGNLFKNWMVWCVETNSYPGTEKEFVQELEESCRDWRGFKRVRKDRFGRGFNGIALRGRRGDDARLP
jgi:putative DNA primase/helicase